MTQDVVSVPCPNCRITSQSSSPGERLWDCPGCGECYVLRRCSGCSAVSHVTIMQQRGTEWACVWCGSTNHGYRRRDPAAATVGDLAADITRRGLELSPPAAGTGTEPALIVTMNEIPGYRITAVHGDVFGLTVRARNYFSNMGAQFQATVGGEVTAYTTLLTDSRNQARERMWHEARTRGANAVVAMRFDCNQIGDIMSEIAAYGTAVTVEPADPAITRPATTPPPVSC
jgi:uncharacterized protein YbjQ (UPF0145 family)